MNNQTIYDFTLVPDPSNGVARYDADVLLIHKDTKFSTGYHGLASGYWYEYDFYGSACTIHDLSKFLGWVPKPTVSKNQYVLGWLPMERAEPAPPQLMDVPKTPAPWREADTHNNPYVQGWVDVCVLLTNHQKYTKTITQGAEQVFLYNEADDDQPSFWCPIVSGYAPNTDWCTPEFLESRMIALKHNAAQGV